MRSLGMMRRGGRKREGEGDLSAPTCPQSMCLLQRLGNHGAHPSRSQGAHGGRTGEMTLEADESRGEASLLDRFARVLAVISSAGAVEGWRHNLFWKRHRALGMPNHMLLVSCLACTGGSTQTIKTMKAMTLMLNNITYVEGLVLRVGGAALRQNRETKKVRTDRPLPPNHTVHSLDWLADKYLVVHRYLLPAEPFSTGSMIPVTSHNRRNAATQS